MTNSKPAFIWSLLLPLPLAAIVIVPLLWAASTGMVKGRTDFSHLYAAAVLIKEGQGHQLYNDDAQIAVQARLFPEGRTPLTHNHLAFEALCLVPLAFLPFPVAIITWLLLNLALLALTMRLLGRHFARLRASMGVPLIVLCLGFYPIGLTILQGQNSIVILCLYAAACVLLRSNRPYLAGVALACALFKFHLVLPTILLLFLYRKRKAVLGFVSAASAVLTLSVLVVGFSGIVQYANNLLTANSSLTDRLNRERFALYPTAYSNIRGFVYWALSEHVPEMTLLVIVVVLSFLALAIAGLLHNRIPPDLRLPFAIVVTTLVSFHLYYYDASMMLIPMFAAADAALAGRYSGKILTISLTLLMLSPLYPLSYLYDFASLMALPMAGVGICLALGLSARRREQKSVQAVAGA